MARVRASGINRGGLAYLGSTLSMEEYGNQMSQEGEQSEFIGLAGLGFLGDATAPAITGISAIDGFIYQAQSQLAEFKMAMTVTTISSLAAAICGVLLIIDSRKR
jgi:hypothetical protein